MRADQKIARDLFASEESITSICKKIARPVETLNGWLVKKDRRNEKTRPK